MRRRDFITAIGGAAPAFAWSGAARAQQAQLPPRIGYLRLEKFITAVNLKTAKSLGVTVPTALLLRADEVIE